MRSRKYKIAGLAAVCLSLASAMLLMANQKPEVSRFGKPATAAQSNRVSLVQDWSHRHLVYSKPQTIVQNLRIQQQQRYVQQVLRRNYISPQPISSRPISPFAPVDRWRPNPVPKPISFHEPEMTNDLHRDWAVVMNAAGQTMGDGSFPAKYIFNANAAPDCVNDFVIFTTSTTGGAAVDIYALNNLYVNAAGTGVCSGTAPNVLWAYHVQSHAGKSVGSPVLSEDGTQVAWMEGGGGQATLHILKPYTGGGAGTLAAPATPVVSLNAAAYRACTPATGNGACLFSIDYANADEDIGFGSGSHIDPSSPYYDYSDDIAFVGDDTGNLHLFTGVFKGDPVEVTSGGWPFTPDLPNSQPLTSPVYDETSSNVFVGDAAGQLSYVHVGAGPGFAPALGANNWPIGTSITGGIEDAPIVDSTTQKVYVFSGSTGGPVVGEDDTTLTPGGRSALVSVGSLVTTPFHAGTFDNNYYTTDLGAGTGTGNLYVCGDNGTVPELYQVAVTNGALGAVTAEFTAATAATECSPVVEFYNATSTTDFIYFSVQASGPTTTDCSGEGCIFGANLSGASTVTMSGAMPASGGTSGMVVDNNSADTAASNIYYTWLGNDSATYPCNGDTSGKGCTVQVSQLGLGSAGEPVNGGAGDSGPALSQTSSMNPGGRNGDLILIVTHWGGLGTTVASVTDNAGGGSNTYTALGGPLDIGLNAGVENYMQAFYAYNIHGLPTNFTVTYSATTQEFSLVDVLDFTGLDTIAPLDAGTYVTNTGTGTAYTVPAPGGNTTADNETILGLFATAQGGGFPFVAGTGFSSALQDNTSFLEFEGAIAIGKYGATGTGSNPVNWGGIVVGFKNAVQ